MDQEDAQNDYNRRPLATCEARYFGRAIPHATTQGPEIILEPLRKLYSPSRHKRKDLLEASTALVTIIVYNSGIIIQQKVKLQKDIIDWYPIQNLYCSAGLKPDKNKKGEIVFKQFNEEVRSIRHPIFAFVVREPGNDGRRVLMCHAFQIENVTLAQQLVSACQNAYTNKEGWNHPLSDKKFLDAKMSYAMQMVDEEASLKKLKLETEERDKHLAQRPEISDQTITSSTRSIIKKKSSVKQVKSSVRHEPTSVKEANSFVRMPASSFKQPRFSHVQPNASVRRMQQPQMVQSAPVTPRRVIIAQQPTDYLAHSRTPSVVMTQKSSRVPTPEAKIYYQGFKSNAMTDSNDIYGVDRASSFLDHPLSRSSTGRMNNSYPQHTPEPAVFIDSHIHVKPTRVSKSRRNHLREPPSTRGHRVLASSEPQEMANGYRNGEAIGVIDWDEAIDDSDLSHMESNGNMSGDIPNFEKKRKHSKHHRPSRKQMEAFSHQNGHTSTNGARIKVQRSSSQSSEKSDSGYSITKLQDGPPKTKSNGFFQTHEHADQAF